MRSFGILGLLFNAATYGLLWYPLRYLQEVGIHGIWVTTITSAIGTATLWFYSKAWRTTLLNSLLTLSIDWQACYRWLPLGFTFSATSICFSWGMLEGEVAKVILLFYIMPLWVIPCAWVLLNEKPARANMLTAALALIGAMLILYRPGLGIPLPSSLGEWLGLIGGMSFAANNVLLRKYANETRDSVIANNYAIGFLCLLPFALFMTSTGAIPLPTMGLTSGLILLSIACLAVVAHIALIYGAAITPVFLTPVILVSEVIWASFSAALLANETFTFTTLAGASIIITAALLASFLESKKHEQRSTDSLTSERFKISSNDDA